MTITLTPETETRLLRKAKQTGQDINDLADFLLADALTNDPDDLTDTEAAEMRVGIGRGLAAAAAGQVKPLAPAVAEARQRHRFPDSWARGVQVDRCEK